MRIKDSEEVLLRGSWLSWMPSALPTVGGVTRRYWKHGSEHPSYALCWSWQGPLRCQGPLLSSLPPSVPPSLLSYLLFLSLLPPPFSFFFWKRIGFINLVSNPQPRSKSNLFKNSEAEHSPILTNIPEYFHSWLIQPCRVPSFPVPLVELVSFRDTSVLS